MQKLGIVAGAGALPVMVAQMSAAKNMTPIIITLSGNGHEDFKPFTPTAFGLTQIESIIAHFIAHDASDIIMVGKVERPVLTKETVIDATSAKLLQDTLPHGDDVALRAVLGVVQQAGLRVLPLQALIPNQILPADYDNGQGDAISSDSLTLAIKTHKRLSSLDVGQAVIVQDKRVIAIEAAEGTDEMIGRAASLLSDDAASLFFKASKSAQHKLLDPPVFGLDTIAKCIASGIGAIAIEAENCILAAPLTEIEAVCASHNIRLVAVTLHEAGE